MFIARGISIPQLMNWGIPQFTLAIKISYPCVLSLYFKERGWEISNPLLMSKNNKELDR